MHYSLSWNDQRKKLLPSEPCCACLVLGSVKVTSCITFVPIILDMMDVSQVTPPSPCINSTKESASPCATLSHHATALNGSDVVYSRELQTGAIRKLQMLLKKIRVGLDPRTEQAPLDAITAAFDSGHKSVVRTPMFESRAPCTPLPVVETDVQQAEKPVECKVETSLHDLCVLAASETAPFGDFIRTKD